jgi:hypothetical protein
MTSTCPGYGWDYDPEIAALHADVAEIAGERDQYAAEAADLRHALSDAHAREVFLNERIAQLRADLAAAERHNNELTGAAIHAPAEGAVPLALAA